MKTELGKGNMLMLVGEGVSPGLAKGKAFIYIDVLKRAIRIWFPSHAPLCYAFLTGIFIPPLFVVLSLSVGF